MTSLTHAHRAHAHATSAPLFRTKAAALAAVAMLAGTAAGQAIGQSSERLVQRTPPPQTDSLYFAIDAATAAAASALSGPEALAQVSTFHVAPPAPREFVVHDLVTIIVDEVTRTSNLQSLETERENEITADLGAILDPWQLLEARLQASSIDDLQLIDLETESEFEGEGEAETVNRFIADITAEIIDIKPNGTLVLQARRVIQTDDLTSTITLTGVVRQEDIDPIDNSVFSSHIANMELKQEQSGVVREAAKKGLITRVLESIFSF